MFSIHLHNLSQPITSAESNQRNNLDKSGTIFGMACKGLISGRRTHNVSCLLGRRLGALLPVDAHKVGQRGTAGEQRGRVGAKEGQQHMFKKQRNRHTFHAADGGVRQLQRKKQGKKITVSLMTHDYFLGSILYTSGPGVTSSSFSKTCIT